MSTIRWSLLLLVGLMAMATGCETNRPFQGDKTRDAISSRSAAPDSSLIMEIDPMTGMVGSKGKMSFEERLAQAMGRLGRVATANPVPERSNWRVQLEMLDEPKPGGQLDLWFQGVILTPSGNVHSRFDWLMSVRYLDWMDADVTLRRQVASGLAHKVLRVLEGRDGVAIVETMHVQKAIGAKGDGDVRLQRGMEQALAKRGLTISAFPNDRTFILTPVVRHRILANREELVEIVWVMQTPHGKQIGKISVANPVAAGSLDHYWGQIAVDAAEGSSDGVVQMIRQVDPGFK